MSRDEIADIDVKRDIDSVVAIASSLTAFRLIDVFDVQTSGIKSSPDQNQKQLRSLNNLYQYDEKLFRWYQFRLGGCMGAGKIYVLFAAKIKTPVKPIRQVFLLEVLKVAAQELDHNSRSDAHNLSGVHPEDDDRSIRIFHEDWQQITCKIDIILRSNVFQEKYGIEKILFYSAIHGMQHIAENGQLGNQLYYLLTQRLQVDVRSDKIVMIAADVSVNIKSKAGEALLVDFSKPKTLMNKFDNMRPPLDLQVYNPNAHLINVARMGRFLAFIIAGGYTSRYLLNLACCTRRLQIITKIITIVIGTAANPSSCIDSEAMPGVTYMISNILSEN